MVEVPEEEEDFDFCFKPAQDEDNEDDGGDLIV